MSNQDIIIPMPEPDARPLRKHAYRKDTLETLSSADEMRSGDAKKDNNGIPAGDVKKGAVSSTENEMRSGDLKKDNDAIPARGDAKKDAVSATGNKMRSGDVKNDSGRAHGRETQENQNRSKDPASSSTGSVFEDLDVHASSQCPLKRPVAWVAGIPVSYMYNAMTFL